MDSNRWQRLKQLLDAALDRKKSEREAFIEKACAGDSRLREELLSMLAVADMSNSFLEEPCIISIHENAEGDDPEDPTHIGRYRIVRRLGEGGMGIVYLAEQEQPIHRQVALKIIRIGMDSREIIARFQTERQALALMNHPNVAKVLDAGSTTDGRPYFVMEYVDGVPITEFCDERDMPTRERLTLFRQVCDGVQHAHQKAVIHRDLKPSNILVAIEENRAVPKIIDFGVAKAIGQRLADQALSTELGVLVGTPEFMSPEQTDTTSDDIDTRTDVYSLGVVLYELMVGALPFDPKELRKAGYEAMLRLIREKEPQWPSMRVITLVGTSAQCANRRSTNSRALANELRGDIDWITMRALHKDRERRFRSPAELSADIGRFLTNRPIDAGPPSVIYRIRKFARRHKAGVATAAVIALLIVAGSAGTTIGLVRAREAEAQARLDAARSERVLALLANAIDSIDPQDVGLGLRTNMRVAVEEASTRVQEPSESLERRLAALDTALDGVNLTDVGTKMFDENLLVPMAETISNDLDDDPSIAARLESTLGSSYLRLGMFERASRNLSRALGLRRANLGDEHRDTLAAMNSYAGVLEHQGLLDEARPLQQEALDGLRRTIGTDDELTIEAMGQMGYLLESMGQLYEAEPYCRETYATAERVLGLDHRKTMSALANLGVVLRKLDQVEEAELRTRDALDRRQRVLGERDSDTLRSLNNLAVLLMDNRPEDAAPLFEKSLELRRSIHGEDHPRTLMAKNNLADIYLRLGRMEEAERLYIETLEKRIQIFGLSHYETLDSFYNLGNYYARAERFPEAEKQMAEVVRLRKLVLPPDHFSTIDNQSSLGAVQYRNGNADAAVSTLQDALRAADRAFAPDHRTTLSAMNSLAAILKKEKRWEESERYYVELLSRLRLRRDDNDPAVQKVLQRLEVVREAQGKSVQGIEPPRNRQRPAGSTPERSGLGDDVNYDGGVSSGLPRSSR